MKVILNIADDDLVKWTIEALELMEDTQRVDFLNRLTHGFCQDCGKQTLCCHCMNDE